jgi:hypothetical protein
LDRIRSASSSCVMPRRRRRRSTASAMSSAGRRSQPVQKLDRGRAAQRSGTSRTCARPSCNTLHARRCGRPTGVARDHGGQLAVRLDDLELDGLPWAARSPATEPADEPRLTLHLEVRRAPPAQVRPERQLPAPCRIASTCRHPSSV